MEPEMASPSANHWNEKDPRPSGSAIEEVSAVSVCPWVGVPEIESDPVAGSLILATV